MRNPLILVVIAACAPPPIAYEGAPAPPPDAYRDVVVSGTATTITVADAVVLDDGGVAVLACVEGTGASGWPTGGVLAKIARDGKIAAVVSADGCRSGRLVRAGADLVVARGGTGDHELVITRFDAALHAGAPAQVPVVGPIDAITGRPDGSIAIAAESDGHDPDPPAELAIIGRDPTNVVRWPLREDRVSGFQLIISQLIPDGDGIIAVGLLRGNATLDSDVVMNAPDDAAFVLRVGVSARWSRVIGSHALTTSSHNAPRIVRVADGFLLAWSVVSTGDRRAYPELDAFGGVPPTGYFTLFARLDQRGAIVFGRREPTDPSEGVQSLQVLPDGSILEQRTRTSSATRHSDECADAHACIHYGGPDASGRIHTLIAQRRDSRNLATLGIATVSGEMMLEHVQLVYAAPSILAVGTFVGTIDLPRGSVTSPRTEKRSWLCAHSSTTGIPTDRDLLGLEPPEDPCQLEVTQHGALFAVRLSVR